MESLNCKSLMIGDWLYYKGQFNAFPFKVESITKKKVGYHAEPNDHRIYYLKLSECKPIPLTPEILEKNHFSRFAKVNWQYDTLSTFFLENPSNPNDYEDNYWLRVGNIMTRIEYVHQLQHALRLCGINHEIIL